MKTAAVPIDAWKLDIFKRHLDEAGYTYTQHQFLINTILLKVQYEWVAELFPVVEAAQAECKKDVRSKA